MFNIKQPFFNLNGEASAGDWGDMARSITLDDAPANEDQPIEESDAEGLEKETAEEQDVVEPNSEEAKEQEPPAEEVPAFNDDTEIDMGEGRQPQKLAELKAGFLRQSDYTKKTQELATQRGELETEQKTIEPYKQWVDFIHSNPWLTQQITTAIQEFNSTGTLPLEEALQDAQYGKYINTLLADNQKLTKDNQSLQSKYGDLEFGTGMDKTISELKADYGDLITPEYEAELRQQAKDESLKPEMVKKIAKGDLAEKKLQQSQQDTKKVTKQAEAKTIQSLQEKRTTLPPQPRTTGQRPSTDAKDPSDMSWLDLAKSVKGQ